MLDKYSIFFSTSAKSLSSQKYNTIHFDDIVSSDSIDFVSIDFDCNEFNKVYNKKKKNGSLNVKYEDWYAERIAYHLNYYNVTDLVICEMEAKQYVITAQLFLLLNGKNLQAQITLINQ